MNWKDISTAPRDGSVVKLCWFEGEDGPFDVCNMYWSGGCTNGLFPDVVGMWESAGKDFTWTEHNGGGPTHWDYAYN